MNSNGVIDHNRFVNNPFRVTAAIADCTVAYGVGVYGGGTATPWESNIQDVLGKYTSRSVFIEDNYFEYGWDLKQGHNPAGDIRHSPAEALLTGYFYDNQYIEWSYGYLQVQNRIHLNGQNYFCPS